MAAGGDTEISGVGSLNAMPTPTHSAPASETCDSCGAVATDVSAVHRVYITPAAWDPTSCDEATEAVEDRVDVVDEVERWCFPCRSQYPHQPLD
jgi:hypothetical protein